jgi:hypothetical protein
LSFGRARVNAQSGTDFEPRPGGPTIETECLRQV